MASKGRPRALGDHFTLASMGKQKLYYLITLVHISLEAWYLSHHVGDGIKKHRPSEHGLLIHRVQRALLLGHVRHFRVVLG